MENNFADDQFTSLLSKTDSETGKEFVVETNVRPASIEKPLAGLIIFIATITGSTFFLSTFASKLVVLTASLGIFITCLFLMSNTSEIPCREYDAEREVWFGHLMSSEAEWTHIPTVLFATHSFVFLYGSVVSLISPDTSLLTIPLFYSVGLLAFYLWHVAAHELEQTELHRIHMEHHQDRYPQRDFYGDSHPEVQAERLKRKSRPETIWSLMNPSSSTTLSFFHEGPLLLSMIAIVVAAKLILGATVITCALALVGYGFMASFGSAVHMSFHERGFQWEHYAWYRELRSLHMIHHMERKNYAMVNVLLDLAFGSLALRG